MKKWIFSLYLKLQLVYKWFFEKKPLQRSVQSPDALSLWNRHWCSNLDEDTLNMQNSTGEKVSSCWHLMLMLIRLTICLLFSINAYHLKSYFLFVHQLWQDPNYVLGCVHPTLHSQHLMMMEFVMSFCSRSTPLQKYVCMF